MRLTLSLLLCLFVPFVMIGQAPVADFSVSAISGCSPLSITITDKSTGNPISWTWSVFDASGNATLYNKQGPFTLSLATGTYSVTLIVKNANGIDQKTQSNIITVNESPYIIYSADKTTTCLPAVIKFTDTSIPNAPSISSWEWDFGDLGTSTLQNPTHQYTATGYYQVSLKVTGSTGCVSQRFDARYIRILNGVTANFDYTGPPTCQPPFVMSYKNLTSGPGNLSYTWDLGNGNTSTLVSPSGTYNTATTYTVKLKGQSDFGCVDSVQKNITITGNTTAFTGPASVCIGSAATFQNTSAPTPQKVLWNFGDGTTSNVVSPSKTYTNPGTYTVTLTSTFANCSDIATKTIIVNDKPVVSFNAPKTNSCKPFTVAFQNTSPDIASAVWDFGDGTTSNSAATTVSHAYTSTGLFDVKLTVTDSKGCTNTLVSPKYININAPVVQMANLPKGLCIGQSFTTTPNVAAPDGVASYLWDFGDGTTFNGMNPPAHSYAIAGFKTIKLSVVTNDGCPGSFQQTIQVGAHPAINFTVDNLLPCRGDSVIFTNTTPGPFTDVLWNFGDSTTAASLANPIKHKFADTGLHNITLTLTSNGCLDSLPKPNLVRSKPPLANFGTKVDCNSKTQVTFLDSSKVDNTLVPFTYKWSFGDPLNSTSTTIPPLPVTFTYPSSVASYNVKLVVTDGVCVDSVTKKLQLVNEVAKFTINKNAFCRNENVVFTSGNNAAFIKTYQWVVDGVAVSGNGTATYTATFSSTGNHTVQLITTDINDCTTNSGPPQSFLVQGVTALFSVPNNTGCRATTTSFVDGSVSTGTITKWTYDFGDGSTNTFNAAPFTHKYTDSGLFQVKLTVLDNIGCSDTYQLPTQLTVTRPRASFTTGTTEYCPGLPLQFIDSSSGRNITYQWNFGDGTTDIIPNPSHTYASKRDSTYAITLVVKDSLGCTDTLILSNYIHILSPKMQFSVTDTVTLCPPLETKFKFLGRDYASFYWDFGDGSNPVSLDTLSHFYNTYGNYPAKLYIYGFGGCVDSATFNIKVTDPLANTTVTFDPKNACNQLTVNFNVMIPFGTTAKFYYGDGAVDSLEQPTLSHFYNFPNLYSPTILLMDKTGCQQQLGNWGQIDIRGAIPLFGMDKSKFCDSGTVYFTDYSLGGHDPIVKKTWDFGDGNTVVAPGDVIHSYTQPGLYTPKFTVSTMSGCDSSYVDTVRILATPKPIITSVDGICNDLTIDFNGSLLVPPDTAITWKWDLSKGLTSNQQNVSLNYPDTGLHHITLEAINSLGCKGDTSKDIVVYPLPSIKLTGDTTLLSGAGGYTIPLTYSANADVFNWTPPTYLSCTDCPNPFANPKFTTTYHLKVTDDNGCISTRDITLIVLCNDKNFFIPNTFSPNNDGANDRFYPRGKGLDHIQALRIFNRWGELVFEKRNFPANDASSGWDGTYKGKTASTDTYIYMIDIICENATIITYKGNVTLIR